MHEDNKSWSIVGVWNRAIEEPQERELVERDYLWASELGKPMADVWLRMRAEPITNPPNARSLRKFEAGNLWEWLLKIILMRAGILQSTQERVESNYEGLLRVSGKTDFIAGGEVNEEAAIEAIEAMALPEKTENAMRQIIAHLKQNYPNGLDTKVIELKSVSSHMMNAVEQTGKALAIHRLQAYHYTKHPNIERADILYLSRDDLRLYEIPVLADTPDIEHEYRSYIERATAAYQSEERPPVDPAVVFDEDLGKFTVNRPLGWSPYLTLLTGLQDQAEFDARYKSLPAAWNRVLTRKKNGQSMTKSNEEKVAEMREWGYDADELAAKLVDEPEETEDND